VHTICNTHPYMRYMCDHCLTFRTRCPALPGLQSQEQHWAGNLWTWVHQSGQFCSGGLQCGPCQCQLYDCGSVRCAWKCRALLDLHPEKRNLLSASSCWRPSNMTSSGQKKLRSKAAMSAVKKHSQLLCSMQHNH
jgi:hypothetical protein